MQDSLGNLNQTAVKTKRLKLAAILGTLAGFGPLSIDMYLPALPHIADELGTSQSLVQLSLSFFMIGLAFGQLISGPLSDIRGRRFPLLIGLVIYSVSSLLCAFSPSIWMFILLRFIQGMSGAAGIVLSRAIVRDLYSGVEMTKFFSLLALVNGIAPILAPVLGGIILIFAPWQGVFLILSVIGLVMFLLVLFSLPESLPVQSRSKGGVKQTLRTFKRLILDHSFIGFVLSQALIHSMLFAYISGSSFVLQNIYGVSAQVFSLIFAANGIGIAAASQVTGRLAGRITEKKLFVAGIVMAFIGSITLMILLIFQASLFVILLPLLIAVSSIGVVSTTGNSLALENQGKTAGSASAFLGVLQGVLASIVAPLTGFGSNPAIAMGVVMAVASTGSFLAFVVLVSRKIKVSRKAKSI